MLSVEDDVWRNVFLFFLAQSFMQHGDSLSAGHYNYEPIVSYHLSSG
jgi:hypothetical protein